ncbi:hypothetical protein HDU85_001719 [Gaertneriomyces sp. JEL0708]|nr:hypothetical protein HDU85_001719 [Gaertneriomyces sp. JEL0708]
MRYWNIIKAFLPSVPWISRFTTISSQTAVNPSTMSTRQPVLFVPHGGGPMPLLKDPSHAELNRFLAESGHKYFSTHKPKAIVLVTAHWETDKPTISSGAQHELYYDYHGFPPETYEIKYPAPGSPEVANRVAQVLKGAGIEARLDPTRGWDHGVFVPMKIMLPNADIPIVQMSVLKSQSAAEHIALGRALGKLREENIAIIGSGMSFHNMRKFKFGGATHDVLNEDFDSKLEDVVTKLAGAERDSALRDWEAWEGAKESHPHGAAEHFMPLFVCAGASEGTAQRVTRWEAMGVRLAGYLWQ